MTEALRRQSSTADSERKYQLISRATIRLFAESRGLDVADDSIRVLAEDVNYRLREIVSVRDYHICLFIKCFLSRYLERLSVIEQRHQS